MIVFKDKTFCPYHPLCKYPCDRALTIDVKEEAKKSNLPIAVFTDFPECFVRWFE